jgi:hypothetical protein
MIEIRMVWDISNTYSKARCARGQTTCLYASVKNNVTVRALDEWLILVCVIIGIALGIALSNAGHRNQGRQRVSKRQAESYDEEDEDDLDDWDQQDQLDGDQVYSSNR